MNKLSGPLCTLIILLSSAWAWGASPDGGTHSDDPSWEQVPAVSSQVTTDANSSEPAPEPLDQSPPVLGSNDIDSTMIGQAPQSPQAPAEEQEVVMPPKTTKVLAVLDFKNAHGFYLPEAIMRNRGGADMGRYFSRAIAVALDKDSAQYKALNQEEFYEILESNSLDLVGKPDPDACAEIHDLTGTDFLITGIVYKCFYELIQRSFWSYLNPINTGSAKERLHFACDVEILDCQSGRTCQLLEINRELVVSKNSKGVNLFGFNVGSSGQDISAATVNASLLHAGEEIKNSILSSDLKPVPAPAPVKGKIVAKDKLSNYEVALQLFKTLYLLDDLTNSDMYSSLILCNLNMKELKTNEILQVSDYYFQLGYLCGEIQRDIIKRLAAIVNDDHRQYQELEEKYKNALTKYNKPSKAPAAPPVAKSKAPATKNKASAKSQANKQKTVSDIPEKPLKLPTSVTPKKKQISLLDLQAEQEKQDKIASRGSASLLLKLLEMEDVPSVDIPPKMRIVVPEQKVKHSQVFFSIQARLSKIEECLYFTSQNLPCERVYVNLGKDQGLNEDSYLAVVRSVNVKKAGDPIERRVAILKVKAFEEERTQCDIVKGSSSLKVGDVVVTI